MDVEKTIKVGENISVKVEEFLPDLILVTFEHDHKLFQGILLDSTNRQLPCGVYSKKFPDSDYDPSADKLYSVKQRHTYFQSSDLSTLKNPGLSLKKTSGSGKSKGARMTVRLRPRQVLCSNCQAICNEKSENVSANKLSSTKPQACNSNRISAPMNSLSTSDSTNVDGCDNRKYRDLRPSRETRQRIQLSSNNFKASASNTKTANLQANNNPVLVPKLIKLRPSDIETATSIGISSLGSDTTSSKPIQSQASLNQCSTFETEETYDSDGKLPKLKLIPGLAIKKNKGKIPKMTISTSGLPNGEPVKDCGIRTRSRGSIDEKVDELITNKTNISKATPNFKPLSETEEGSKEEIPPTVSEEGKKECSIVDEEESKPVFPNPPVTSVPQEEECLNYNLPKLTILPLGSKVSDTSNQDPKLKAEKSEKMNLRKKRSVGSMEDLWDERIFDENKKIKCDNPIVKETGTSLSSEEAEGSTDSEKPKTTPILKISFGPGKGTVLKIPAKSTISENDSTESEGQGEVVKKNKHFVTKAARKALKRAKKEAQKKAIIGSPSAVLIGRKSRFGGKSPMRLGGMSPARLSGFSPGRFGGTSPGRFGGTSPGRFGGTSPGRFGGASPGRFGGTSPGRFGGASPARFGGGSPSIFGGMISQRNSVEGFFRSQSRKHKHKVKHKKKHKEDRKHKSDENAEPNNIPPETVSNKEEAGPLTETTNMDMSSEKVADNGWKVPSSPDQPLSNSSPIGSPKQNVLQNPRHKLSISIKRVSNASYVTCDPNNELEKKDEKDVCKLQADLEQVTKCTTLSNINIEGSKLNASPDQNTFNSKPSFEENDFNYLNITPEREVGSDQCQSSDETGEIPEFPCISAGNLEQEEDAALLLMKLGWHDVDSCESQDGLLKVGDIVWGKVTNIPWWPAKIIRLKVSSDTCRGNQAQVCWYGSATSSLLQTDSLEPFLKKFHIRYRKKREGPYQDAVREANIDADQLLKEAEQALNLCESPITASPREVNVVS